MSPTTFLAALLFLQVPQVAQVPHVGAEVAPAEFRARREALARELFSGIVFLEGGAGDSNRRFVQDNNFWYLTGVAAPGAALMLVVEDGRIVSERVYLPARNRMREAWDGQKLAPGPEAEQALLIQSSAPAARAAADIAAALPSAPTVFTLLAAPARRAGLAPGSRPAAAGGPDSPGAPGSRQGAGPRARGEPASAVLAQALASHDGIAVTSLAEALAELRVVKSPAEQELLRRTVEITCAAMIEGFAAVAPGAFEYEVEATVESGFRRRGSVGLAFPTIIGSGPNSCVLHYRDNTRLMAAGEVVVMDVGSKFGFYSADVTRTVPTSGKFTPRQREIYGIVLAAQKAALAVVRPGVAFGDVHRAAAEVIRAANYGPFFNHGTSHHLGLDVHDPGGRRGRVLAAGMVITVEPGIYLPEEKIGFRIEDVVLVTETGYEHLSRFLPREVDELEALLEKLRAERPPQLEASRFFRPDEEPRKDEGR